MERLTHAETETTLVVGLSGEIVMDLVADLKDAITALLRASSRDALVVDLGGVTFMDSSAIGLLIGLRRACADDGKTFQVINPTPPLRKLFEVLRLTHYFAVPPDQTVSCGA